MASIKSKTCIEDGCKKIPTFNYENLPNALYCAIHKKLNMINVKHKTCLENNCKTRPVFNF